MRRWESKTVKEKPIKCVNGATALSMGLGPTGGRWETTCNTSQGCPPATGEEAEVFSYQIPY